MTSMGDRRDDEPLGSGATVLVVGASLAGLRACESLRQSGFAGRVVLLGGEQHLPYDRPPLSKQYLAGQWDIERVRLRSRDAIDALDVDLRLGVRAGGLDLVERCVLVEDGTRVAFDGLVVATGATARPWPSPTPPGVVTVRTLEDATALRAALAGPARRLVVVGGGFLGLEVAATARTRGLDVAVVEPLATLLGRVLPPELGAFVRGLHERAGVAVHTGVGVTAILGEDRVEGVRLGDGTVVAADVVVVAIGALPETGWLGGSGLSIDDGVVCDTSLHAGPRVVAAGDVARFPAAPGEGTMRLEHWTNAAEQGAHAARALLAGREAAEPFTSIPYVWSDQYESKLQIVGLPGPDDDVVVVDGSYAEGAFVACCGRDGRLVAAIGAGRPRRLMAVRPLLARAVGLHEVAGLLGG